MTEQPSLFVGLQSGTSMDGMDAALVKFVGPTRAKLLAWLTSPYSDNERAALDGAYQSTSAADLARLHGAIGSHAVTAVQQLLEQAHVSASHLSGIAFPGHTVWHEPPAVTWQLGDPARVAEAFGVPVVHDFRSRDVAAGGQGAPLVPMADVLLFGNPDEARILLNVGGIANATWVPRLAVEEGVIAFDTGPGMRLIDSLAGLIEPSLDHDADGVLARQGEVDQMLLEQLLADEFFARPPPKSTGREQFGDGLARRILETCPGPDSVATATELTAESIVRGIRQWLPPAREVVISGGGRRHPVLRESLARKLADDGRDLRDFDDLYFDGDAKEAVAFALLGYLTIHGQPGNVPAATGARHSRVLGSVTPG